jgi:uncharacterized protein (DUF433 family)
MAWASALSLGSAAADRPARPQPPRSGVLSRRDRERADGPDRAGEEFFERVDWSGDQPAGWRPHENPVSPIRINPLVRFGMPAIGGISTEAIAGDLEGGASLEKAAEDFGLDLDAVRWAQSYELSQRAAI